VGGLEICNGRFFAYKGDNVVKLGDLHFAIETALTLGCIFLYVCAGLRDSCARCSISSGYSYRSLIIHIEPPGSEAGTTSRKHAVHAGRGQSMS